MMYVTTRLTDWLLRSSYKGCSDRDGIATLIFFPFNSFLFNHWNNDRSSETNENIFFPIIFLFDLSIFCNIMYNTFPRPEVAPVRVPVHTMCPISFQISMGHRITIGERFSIIFRHPPPSLPLFEYNIVYE